jgi:hypothetical protein
MHNKQYVLSLQTSENPNQSYSTLNFDELVNGFTSFFTFKPTQFFSIRNKVYSLNAGSLWMHYSPTASVGSFYGVALPSSITFVLNENAAVLVKTLKQ